MAQINYLPFEMVVDVNIKLAANYPAKKSFQTLLILAHSDDETQRGVVNEYSRYQDAVDDGATDTVRDILAVIFSQQERAKFVKVGYIDSALDLESELNRIANIDNNFVFMGVTDEITHGDIDRGDTIAMWGNANRKLTALLDTNPNALDINEDSLTRKLMLKNYNRVFSVMKQIKQMRKIVFLQYWAIVLLEILIIQTVFILQNLKLLMLFKLPN